MLIRDIGEQRQSLLWTRQPPRQRRHRTREKHHRKQKLDLRLNKLLTAQRAVAQRHQIRILQRLQALL